VPHRGFRAGEPTGGSWAAAMDIIEHRLVKTHNQTRSLFIAFSMKNGQHILPINNGLVLVTATSICIEVNQSMMGQSYF
jgi:hypothetical protein